MAVEKVFRVVVSGVLGGSVTFNNAFHLATDTPGVGPGLNAADVATNFRDALIYKPVGAISRSWRNATSAFCQFNSVTVNSLYPDGTEMGTAGIAQTGTAAGAVLPAPCAGIITWRTAHAGRRGRGRTYFGGMQYYSGGFLGSQMVAPGPTERGFLTNIGNDFITNLGPGGSGLGAGWYLVILSRLLAGSTPPINPVGCFPVLTFSVPNYWATMGSRRGGHGI